MQTDDAPAGANGAHPVRRPTRRGSLVLVVLILIQMTTWILAVVLSEQSWQTIALGGVAYTLGLRHGLDADHISVIDNVSRHLIERGERADSIGLLFALGHSVVVSVLALFIGVTAIRANGAFAYWREWMAAYSTLISVAVLFLIAPRNAWAAWQMFRQLGSPVGSHATPSVRGLSARLVRGLLRIEVRTWHMFVIGALFGLGFETATAISMMGLTASQASGGGHIAMVMIFPLLFTAGMTLVDGLDGIFMERAYCWAAANPKRHALYYLSVTSLAALVATGVGSFELIATITRARNAGGGYSRFLEYVEGHFESIGAGIMALFAIGWIGSVATTRPARS